MLKSDPYKGIAIPKDSIPIKLSSNGERREVAPGSVFELAWLEWIETETLIAGNNRK